MENTPNGIYLMGKPARGESAAYDLYLANREVIGDALLRTGGLPTGAALAMPSEWLRAAGVAGAWPR